MTRVECGKTTMRMLKVFRSESGRRSYFVPVAQLLFDWLFDNTVVVIGSWFGEGAR